LPTVEIPEVFRCALAQGVPARVCQLEATTPQALFGRALARIAVGREADARKDLEAALPHLGDASRIELAFLDIRERNAVKGALAVARAIAERAEPNSLLAARALHVAGLAEGKLRHTAAATDALLRSAEIYGALGERLGQAQVYDTLGMVEGARGRLDYALNFYALSLVDKTMLGDRQGMAITLGNLGRVHLRAGRFRDALFCFERDLLIARELGDERGQARMHEDMGRAHLGLEELAKAEQELRECLKIASRCSFKDMEFFARKDLVLTRIAQGRLEEAETELEMAEAALPAEAEPYFRLILTAARGDLLMAKGDKKAIDVLEEAVEGFEQAQLPDLEIPARISLAKALVSQRYKALAEQCLLRGLRLARSDGYARYLPTLNEAMAGLDLVEGAIEETARQLSDGPSPLKTSYIIREQLGSGAFGEVFRVYDPQRGQDVALKRLRLEKLYDLSRRKQLLASARVELEAASRVRHPGVVRVLAIGTEPDGGTYIVQEYVPGRPLQELFPKQKDASADPHLVVSYVERIANALQALHEAGVVHRDLKPANILVRADGLPVLVDFGIAHMMDAKGAKDPQMAGTLPYMAPEQAMGRRLDGRADLYALGVIAYEWLAGVRPLRLRGSSLEDMARDIATRQPPPLSDFLPVILPELERLIMSMLAKKRRQRPASALEVVEECQRLARSLPPEPGAPPHAGNGIERTQTMDQG